MHADCLSLATMGNRVQLMREYWASRMREIASRGVSESDANEALSVVVDHMESNRTIAAPVSIITNSTVLDVLCACGLVRTSGQFLTFGHQSYLDYQVANRVVREMHSRHQDVLDWLGTREHQSIYRREQLRQISCLLSEESKALFLKTAQSILESSSVRFHLKHLCLEVKCFTHTETFSALVSDRRRPRGCGGVQTAWLVRAGDRLPRWRPTWPRSRRMDR